MNENYLGLTIASLLFAGCFAPSDAEDGGTDGSTGQPPTSTSASTEPTESDGSGETTGGDTDPDLDDDDDASSTGAAEGSTGATTLDPSTTGEASTGGEETGDESSTETGEPIDCELGTVTDCLACGDACGLDAECHPQGCLEPVALGHADGFDNLGGLDGFLWGFPVDVPNPSWITHLGFIANGMGGSVQLSLYSDAAGAPFARLITADPVVGYTAGTHELEVEQTMLEPGVYWLMATATNPTRLAVDLNNGQVNFPVQGIVHDFADGHPDTVAEPISFVNFRPNFYLRALQSSEE